MRPTRTLGAAHAAALGIVAAALLGARPAGALSMVAPQAVKVGDWAGATFRVSEAFSDRIEQTLDRGMPTTVLVTIDLWEDKPGWFDRLVAEQTVAWRASRNVWSDDFTLRRGTEPEHTVPDVEAVEAEIGRALRVRIAPLSGLSPEARYYVLVTVTVKPLTVEDLRRVEDWLSGEAKRSGKPGPGSIARLPRYLVGVLANLSGLGDETLRWRSTSFRPAELPAGP
jgi:hypothetical protein